MNRRDLVSIAGVAACVTVATVVALVVLPDGCADRRPDSTYVPSEISEGGHWFDVNGDVYGWALTEHACIEAMTHGPGTPAALVELVTKPSEVAE